MKSNPYNFEKIEDFFLEKLSDVEKQDLLQASSTDPMLAKEIEFQDEIISALKEKRKQQLKARLDNIAIDTPKPLLNFQNVSISVGVVALLSVLGIFVYNKVATDNSEAISQSISVNTQTITPIEDKKLEETENTAVYTTPDSKITNQPAKQETQAINKNIAKNNTKVNEVKPTPQVNNTPVIVQEEVKNTPDSAINTDNTSKESVAEKRSELKYKYYNGKLYVYGDYSAKKQILEANINNEKRIFLFYNGDFYEINQNQVEIAQPNKVVDTKLIEDLNTLKQKIFKE